MIWHGHNMYISNVVQIITVEPGVWVVYTFPGIRCPRRIPTQHHIIFYHTNRTTVNHRTRSTHIEQSILYTRVYNNISCLEWMNGDPVASLTRDRSSAWGRTPNPNWRHTHSGPLSIPGLGQSSCQLLWPCTRCTQEVFLVGTTAYNTIVKWDNITHINCIILPYGLRLSVVILSPSMCW